MIPDMVNNVGNKHTDTILCLYVYLYMLGTHNKTRIIGPSCHAINLFKTHSQKAEVGVEVEVKRLILVDRPQHLQKKVFSCHETLVGLCFENNK